MTYTKKRGGGGQKSVSQAGGWGRGTPILGVVLTEELIIKAIMKGRCTKGFHPLKGGGGARSFNPSWGGGGMK